MILNALPRTRKVEQMSEQKPNEWWVYQNDEYGTTYAVEFNQRGFNPESTYNPIRVVESSALHEAQAEIARLRSALEFYANENNWYRLEETNSIISDVDLYPVKKRHQLYPNQKIAGKKAREALNQKSEGET